MPKEENQAKTTTTVDASIAINKRNEKYPHLKKMTLKDAAEQCGVTTDTLVKIKRNAPKIVAVLLKLKEIGECEIEDFVTQKQQ